MSEQQQPQPGTGPTWLWDIAAGKAALPPVEQTAPEQEYRNMIAARQAQDRRDAIVRARDQARAKQDALTKRREAEREEFDRGRAELLKSQFIAQYLQRWREVNGADPDAVTPSLLEVEYTKFCRQRTEEAGRQAAQKYGEWF